MSGGLSLGMMMGMSPGVRGGMMMMGTSPFGKSVDMVDMCTELMGAGESERPPTSHSALRAFLAWHGAPAQPALWGPHRFAAPA